MPIYEYKCQKCERTIEVMQKISDPAPAKCEACGADNSFERLVSRSSFQLKGGGWYSDLYSSKKTSGSGSGESTTASTTTKTEAPAAASTTSTATTPSAPSSSSSGGGTSGSSA